jgi:SAM-dependent methyltransferase
MYAEWEANFLAYLKPHEPGFLRGKRVLDAGCGNGRHAYYAGLQGADVWAVDLGPAVEVARHNTMGLKSVQVVQADLNNLPFQKDYFDFIYSIGVLHHLSDPEVALRNLIACLKPGGEIQVYLYWKPERQFVKRLLLSAVKSARTVTTRLPYRVTYALSYPAAVLAYCFFVWPYRVLSRVPGMKAFAEQLPMKQYARYPFRVCINDQFDRFSAPIEKRYTRAEVESCLSRAGLEAVTVLPNFGWNGSGRKPLRKTRDAAVPRAKLRCVELRG